MVLKIRDATIRRTEKHTVLINVRSIAIKIARMEQFISFLIINLLINLN